MNFIWVLLTVVCFLFVHYLRIIANKEGDGGLGTAICAYAIGVLTVAAWVVYGIYYAYKHLSFAS